MKLDATVNPTLSWRPALDGLRAIAVACVMLRHFKTESLLPGGVLGVDLFFVLSGFLITTLLMQEWQSSGSISLVRFYQRRALRLLPALYAFLFVYLLIVFSVGGYRFSFAHLGFTGAQSPKVELTSVLGSVLYCFNWLRALDGIPGAGTGHLWSLAVEEQYYFLWPAALLLMLRLRLHPLWLLGLSGAIILWSASLPLWSGASNIRLYFGTDFRVQELMMGSLAGQLYAFGIVSKQTTESHAFRALLTACVCLLATLLFVLRAPASFLFAGSYLVIAMAAAAVVLACVFGEGGPAMRALSSRAMVYAGKRSYALYLWHFPVSYWLRDLPAVPQVAAAAAITLLAAELSFRLVESPALRLKARLSAHTSKPKHELVPVVLLAEPESPAA